MPAYVIGARRTEKGHQNLKEFSAVLDRFKRVREANGGTLIQCYATFGRFDMVMVAEFPSGTAMQRAMTTMLSEGVFALEVFEAMPMTEFLAILKEEEQEHKV
jgi:uncharacterized protein with GYD domain